MRGIYGQAEGNETRTDREQLVERIADNQIVEGDIVASLRRLVADHNWKGVEVKMAKLAEAGHSQSRRESMLTRAMAGLRF